MHTKEASIFYKKIFSFSGGGDAPLKEIAPLTEGSFSSLRFDLSFALAAFRLPLLFISFYLCREYGSFADTPWDWQIGFQDPASPVMQGLIDLHHDVFFFMIFILFFVLWIGVRTLYNFNHKKNPIPEKIIHGTTIEIAWTTIPSLVLICIALPSFALLYSLDETVDPAVTVKGIGHQWYWSYEYSDYGSEEEPYQILFDSYMIPDDDLEYGEYRLLEVDNRIVLPVHTHIRMVLTAADVIHSWAVPSLGVKCDAIPGRLNGVPIFIKREGVYYGQCSELCGANHAFMPIVVEAVTLENYISWLYSNIESI
jgi:cytochrome c oxidase subunit 2